jgi:hypothetical protein
MSPEEFQQKYSELQRQNIGRDKSSTLNLHQEVDDSEIIYTIVYSIIYTMLYTIQPRHMKFTRKLNKLGKYTYTVVIPKAIIDNLEWREHQKVTVSLESGRKIEIKDWKK